MSSPASRSTPFAGSQPEFFIDRCLGHPVASGLTRLGWNVHLVNHYFPEDAQRIPDEEWITYGLCRGWHLLSQDGRIRYKANELGAIAEGQGSMFCLNSGNLTIEVKVSRLHAHQAKIYREATKGEVGFFAVHETGIRKKWP